PPPQTPPRPSPLSLPDALPIPGAVVAVGEPGEAAAEVPLLADRPLVAGAPAAYVCRHFACETPTTDPTVLGERLGAVLA
ncbi:hypothetical protein, partial [Streptomyces sp. CBMA123]|uniref:hypothetical protein n=1 Tax=Streptomyces sp. CBMA123 TaxID=1896313 RepID=UPI001CB801E1